MLRELSTGSSSLTCRPLFIARTMPSPPGSTSRSGQIAGPPTGVFVFFWLVAADLALPASIPLWGRNLLSALGPYLFVGLLERYLRRRIQQRRALGPTTDDDG